MARYKEIEDIEQIHRLAAATLPYYDQEYVEELFPHIIRVKNKLAKSSKNLSDVDKEAKFYNTQFDLNGFKYIESLDDFLRWRITDKNDRVDGGYTPELRTITLSLKPGEERQSVHNLRDTWLHEAQHSLDRDSYYKKDKLNDDYDSTQETNAIDDYNKDLFTKDEEIPDNYARYVLQPGETRAGARTIGHNLREDVKKYDVNVKDLKSLWYYVTSKYPVDSFEFYLIDALDNALDATNNYSKDFIRKKLGKNYKDKAEVWYNTFYSMLQQAMDEGRLRGVYSDKKLKNVEFGNFVKHHVVQALQRKY